MILNEESNTMKTPLIERKVVVTDTSSLLVAGTKLLKYIKDSEFVIPSIVINELENKRTHASLGFFARQWINLLETLRIKYGSALSDGVALDNTSVTIRIEPNHRSQQSLPENLQNGSNDSTILAVAKNLFDENPEKELVILSNDNPMRLHATLELGLEAKEVSLTILNHTKPFSGKTSVTITEDELEKFGFSGGNGDFDKISKEIKKLITGERIGSHLLVEVFLENVAEPIAYFTFDEGRIEVLERFQKVSKVSARTPEQDAALKYLLAPVKDVTFVSLAGSAGTGKTLLAVASGVQALRNNEYQKVIVFRSLHEMGQNQEMGFLPGDVNDKMKAWAGAVYDAIDVLAYARYPRKKNEVAATMGTNRKKEVEHLKEMIEISPITYLRGRSLANSYIVIEEAQNFSRNELLNIISRVGIGSKLVMTFDSMQVDAKYLHSGDKADVWSVISDFKNESIFSHITLTKTERSRLAELASRILEKA